MKDKFRIIFTALLVIVLLFSFYRIADYTFLFSRQSLQMDYSAYYTAGKSLNSGFNPYENNIFKGFEFWDGYGGYKHSRFLYPPLAAELFRPLALLKYKDSKVLWNILNLFFYLLVFVILAGKYMKGLDFLKLLLSAVLYLNFFPFIALLERGQADCITLFLLSLSFLLLAKNSRGSGFISGIAAAAASLFKLYLVLLIPFLLIKKKLMFVYGYLTGAAVIALLTFIFYGTGKTIDYLGVELPRIAVHASVGTDDMKIPVDVLQTYFPMTQVSVTIQDGKIYRTESVSFNSKASLVKITENISEKAGFNIPNIVFTAVFYAIALLIMYFASSGIKDESVSGTYWIILLLLVLLVSPFTWVMSLVWTAPAVFILIGLTQKKIIKKNYIVYGLLVGGFILTAFPDNLLITERTAFDVFFKSRFIIGEIMLITALIIIESGRVNSDNTQGLKNTAST